MSTEPSPRRYRSPLRAEQAAATRTAVLEAAHRLFDAKGWQVGVREIAAAAGCSVETIYAGFGSKLGLLLAVMDVGVVGDQQEIPLAERAEFQALRTGTQAERAAKAVALAIPMHRRTAGLQRALKEAAQVDAQAAEEVALMHSRMALTQRAALALLLGREPTEEQLLDFAVVASPATYLLFVEERGLTDEQFAAWAQRHIARLIRTRQ